jgi:hypothetical protein
VPRDLGCYEDMNDDFYIGWEDKAPASHGRATRRLVMAVGALAMLAAVGLAASQRLIGTAFFEWGTVREFTGVLRAEPYPHLILPAEDVNRAAIAAPLVAPFKFGVRHEAICGFDGQRVTLRATRIHRDQQLMLELEPGSVKAAAASASPGAPRATNVASLGRHTFRGEIVDSKCWMGVMNPGVLTPHRACAVRCISGGIPPMLLVRRKDAPPLNLLLTDTAGRPVNDRVLDLVAEPVEITGEVVRDGELLTLRADPSAYRRIR